MKEPKNPQDPVDQHSLIQYILARPLLLLALIFIAIVIVVSTVVGMKGKWPSRSDIFTEYVPMKFDSLGNAIETPALSDADSLNQDSDTMSRGYENVSNTKVISSSDKSRGNAETIRPDSSAINNADTQHISLTKFNTSYKKIDIQTEVSRDDKVLDFETSNRLFRTLLISSPEDEQKLVDIFAGETLSHVAIMKAISLAGQSIILNQNNVLATELLDVFVSSDNISSIYILDGNREIQGSSPLNNSTASTLNSIKSSDLDSQKIEIINTNNVKIICLPIFHTYGRIGTAVVVVGK